jgi:(p)ppGpp synthase/HD superfamily hydrolase
LATTNPPYALTNVDLFHELQAAEYAIEDLTLVRKGYELAISLFAGRFQPSGRCYLAHVVRTASILGHLRASAEVIAAALLHNVYVAGDFGDLIHGMSSERRSEIAQVLGAQTEEYLAKFPGMNLEHPNEAIQLALNNPQGLSRVDRDLLMLMLAEHLEHLIGVDILYYPDQAQRYYVDNAPTAVAIAKNLGQDALAAELVDAHKQLGFMEVQPELRVSTLPESLVVAPRSFKKRSGLRLALAEGKTKAWARISACLSIMSGSDCL